jgi:serine/threonine protein kinase
MLWALSKFDCVTVQAFEGGLGRVYVVAEGSQQFILKTTKATSAPQREAFKREARAWIKIGRHPNVVPAFWTDEIAGLLFVAADFVPSDALGRTTLRDYMRGRALSLQLILRWSAEFCFAMQFAQSRGMPAHRDIKPDNLLIGAPQALQITDFGLTTTLQRPLQGSHMAISGTPPYMAPEQWTAGSQSIQTDIYAFGVVLHELCFGRFPWAAKTAPEFAQTHLNSAPSLGAHPLSAVIQACLAKSPDKRPNGPQGLLSMLEEVATKNKIPLPPRPEPIDDAQWELHAVSSLGSVGDPAAPLTMARERISTCQWASPVCLVNAAGMARNEAPASRSLGPKRIDHQRRSSSASAANSRSRLTFGRSTFGHSKRAMSRGSFSPTLIRQRSPRPARASLRCCTAGASK